jgi:hypothetical protein
MLRRPSWEGEGTSGVGDLHHFRFYMVGEALLFFIPLFESCITQLGPNSTAALDVSLCLPLEVVGVTSRAGGHRQVGVEPFGAWVPTEAWVRLWAGPGLSPVLGMLSAPPQLSFDVSREYLPS